MFRWILSHSFKDDVNTDYGIYPEGEDVVMEVVDRNTEYEKQAAGGDETNDYDNMYDKVDETSRRQISNYEETYDNMYDKMG